MQKLLFRITSTLLVLLLLFSTWRCSAMPEATQRALIAAIKSQTGDFIMYLDAEQGVLCYEGALYLFDVPNDSVLTSYLQPIALDEDLLQILHPIPEIE